MTVTAREWIDAGRYLVAAGEMRVRLGQSAKRMADLLGRIETDRRNPAWLDAVNIAFAAGAACFGARWRLSRPG